MALLRCAVLWVAVFILGALTLPAQPTITPAVPSDEPLLFHQQVAVIPASGLRGWACAVTRDGKTLVTCAGSGEQSGEILIWDLDKGEVKRSIRHTIGIRSIAISPDDRTIAAGCFGGELRLYDLATGELRASGKAHEDGISGVAYTADGKRLVTAGLDRTAKVWQLPISEAKELKPYASLEENAGRVYAVAISRDGKTLATGSHDGTIKLWDFATGKAGHTLQAGDPVRTLAFLPDGTLLSGSHEVSTFAAWNIGTGKRKEQWSIPNKRARINRIRVSPDGRTLALVTNRARPTQPNEQQGQLLIWDLASNKVLAQSSDTNPMLDAAFSPDGKMIATVGGVHLQLGEIKLWHARDAKLLGELHGQVRWLEAVAFMPDGRLLSGGGINRTASTSPPSEVAMATPLGPTTEKPERGELHIWDTAGMLPELELKGHSNYVGCAAWHPGSEMLATGGGDQRVVIWSLSPTRQGLLPDKKTLQHEGLLRAVRFSPDGKLLAACDETGRVTLWDPHPGQRGHSLVGHSTPAYNLAFSPDGKTLVSCSGNWRTNSPGEVKCWDVSTGNLLGTLDRLSRGVWSIAFNPKGDLLAVGLGNGQIQLYKVATRKLQRAVSMNASLRNLAFSPDGSLLAVSKGIDNDPTVHVWETKTWQERMILRGHQAMILTVRFSLDSKTLITASKDATMKLWSVKPRDEG